MDVSSCITAPASVGVLPSSHAIGLARVIHHLLLPRPFNVAFGFFLLGLFILCVYYLLSRFAAIMRDCCRTYEEKRRKCVYIMCVRGWP